ncbi:MAG: hypothetical protein DCC55_20640, partial [Chloroflexi bacterium]
MYYRLLQFLRGLGARVDEEEIQRAMAVLPHEAQVLFQRMPHDAQRHSLNVLASLQAANHTDADLA